MKAIQITIESGIPMPSDRYTGADTLKSQIDAMEVGQSFACNYEEIHGVRASYNKLRPKKFASRFQKAENKYRVWRME